MIKLHIFVYLFEDGEMHTMQTLLGKPIKYLKYNIQLHIHKLILHLGSVFSIYFVRI